MTINRIDPRGLDLGALSGFRNKAMNGCFRIWQNGTTGFIPDGSYFADMWRSAADTLAGASITTELVYANQPATDYNQKPCVRQHVSTKGSCTFLDLYNRIEGVATIQNRQVTVSFLHRFGTTPKNVQVHVTQVFGSGGSATTYQALAPSQMGSNDAGFTRMSFTGTVPSIAGKTIGSGNFIQFTVRIDCPENGDYFDITEFQVELGGVATPFEYRPFEVELALCSRYYQTIDYLMATTNAVSGGVYPSWSYPVPMRAIPTYIVSFSAGTGATFVMGTRGFYQNTDHSQASTFNIKLDARL